jgi:DNA relaxase NicK
MKCYTNDEIDAMIARRYDDMEAMADLFPEAEQDASARDTAARGPAGGHRPEGGGTVGNAAAVEGFDSPPSVIRGAKLHEGEVGIDTVRMTMPREYLEDATQRVSEFLGQFSITNGISSYAERRAFGWGAYLAYSDEARPEFLVVLSGETCGKFGDAVVLDLVRWVLDQGGKATRIDVRIDFKGERVGLIDAVHASCEARQLCRCKVWQYIAVRTAEGEHLGRGVLLGKRGKEGSGRYVRVYDKGLETGEKPPRTWERWEVEFSKDAADKVAHRLVDAARWEEEAVAVAFGAMELREYNGSRSLMRRPLAKWWADLLANVRPITVKVERAGTNLQKLGGWLRQSVLPTLDTMAREAGLTRDEVMRFFSGVGNLAKPTEDAPTVVWEFVDELGVIEDARTQGKVVRDGMGGTRVSGGDPARHAGDSRIALDLTNAIC